MITYRPIERWPRELTPHARRKRSPFKASYYSTLQLLERELRHAGARGAVVQLAMNQSQFRVSDGKPYADATPTHPGIAYLTWIENLRAVALALDALRRVDRYGVTKHGEQYRGWNALPPAGPAIVTPMSVEEAARWLGNEGGAVPWQALCRNASTFRAAYRRAAMKYHPDANGGAQRAEWSTLAMAKNVLDKHHGGVTA